jgi:membrane fusion protein, macrolide-specific efflux system
VSDWLDPLRHILDRSPQTARVFFCDDNVGRDSLSLRQMLDLFAAHRVPIDLGLTRELLDGNLAEDLRSRLESSSGRVGLHQRGFSRVNREAAARSAHRKRPHLRVLRTHKSAAQRAQPELHAAPERIVTVIPGNPPLSLQSLVSVDWCSHSTGDYTTSREHLGRLIAVAASRGQPVGITLDHSRITGNELRALGELLVLLANHRRAECLPMRDLARLLPGANNERVEAAPQSAGSASPTHFKDDVSAQVRGVSARRLLRDRLTHTLITYRWWVLAACIAAAGFLGWHWLAEGRAAGRYLTAPVVRGDIENTVLSAGTLQPYEFVDVGAQTSGQLKSLKVRLGDKVAKGQLLAEIDPVISASKVAEAEATLAGLKAQWAGKQEQLELAARQKARSEELQRQGAQADSDAEVAESNYKLARNALAALDAELKQARAALQTAQANLEYTRITAPMAGEVVSISAREGQTLNATQQAPTLLRIATLDTMTVWAQVPEADVSRLRLGQDVYFTLLGQTERRWHSRLRQILPSPEIVANVVFYDALFDVPNPVRELKVQMTAQVFFVLDEAKNALYVPLSALTATKSGKPARAVVRRLDGNGRVDKRRVEVGITNAVSAQILAGLNDGDVVVVGEADPGKAKDKAGPVRVPGPK